jgi:hypothetical protein
MKMVEEKIIMRNAMVKAVAEYMLQRWLETGSNEISIEGIGTLTVKGTWKERQAEK